ncbi:MAG: C10 family peptidase [Prevotellaceae bacterium]|jgi:hypothetical protein|nr:C10 family peptidase [Prevotellaceae bacterium]
MKNKILLFILCLPIIVQAQQVTLDEANIVGKNAIINFGKSEQKLSVKSSYTLQDEDNNVLLYEIVLDNGQAVLLSGNKMCMPVLGYYRLKGISVFDTLSTEVPCCLKFLIKGYAEQVKSSFQENFKETEHNATWQELITQNVFSAPAIEIVSPLIKSIWHQDESKGGHNEEGSYYKDCEAYNYYVSETSKRCDGCSSSNKCTTGCIAVAMAQVMYYWKYPMQYDWCNMVDSLDTRNTNCRPDTVERTWGHENIEVCDTNPNYEKQRNAVAKLIYDCAESMNTTYCFNKCSSLALPSLMDDILRKKFDYHKDTEFRWKSSYVTTWKTRLKTDLNNGRPVIYGSLGTKADAHCFICDGYSSDDYFHFNFGWGGNHDAWFKLDYIRPANSIYDISEYAVTGIQPKDDFDYCNYNVTINMPIVQTVPKYATNLTVDFNLPILNSIYSEETVEYTAHNSITIKPGFTAQAGSNFRAYIEPCESCDNGSQHAPQALPRHSNYQPYENENIDNAANGNIMIFPNPNKGVFEIQTSFNQSEISKIEVRNILGQVIFETNRFVNKININVNAGIYFVSVFVNNQVFTEKLIIE